MQTRVRYLWHFVLSAALTLSGAVFVFGTATAARTINLPDPSVANAVVDDDAPDVTARVARISFIRGEAQVKRLETDEWEQATLNLPLVEGDEVTTAAGSRVEIQFDNYKHLRLDENAYVKIAVLKDEGIALSLSLGSMYLSITRLDKDESYLEVDAPRSTIAVQKAGSYRIDAGRSGDAEIKMSVSDGGEARVYSETAGFTVRSGHAARLTISGENEGDWEPIDTSLFADEFDSWSRGREATIAQRLSGAFYDKYYDQDIYGADELNGYGEWVYISQYGYVWRPYSNALNTYADWSPYRYGSWRFVPPFGWTWVNDEPWGWATYHHGRWIYHSGNWYWTPYGYHRYARSWWFPALVVINVFNNNVCWYPLGYHHSWFDFNAQYHHNHGWNGGGHHGGGHNGGHNPPPTPGPSPAVTPIRHPRIPPSAILADEVPVSGVVAVSTVDFGGTKTIRAVPPVVAKAVLAKAVDDSAPVLPEKTRGGSDIIVPRPKTDLIAAGTRVGAAPRKTDAPLDDELRTVRIRGGREPVRDAPITGGGRSEQAPARDPRKTGAVERTPVKPAPVDNDTPIRQVPPFEPAPTRQPPVRTAPPDRPPVKVPPTSIDPPTRRVPPAEPAPVRQPPRSEPPTRQPPRQEAPPKSSPPTKAPPAKGSGSKAKAD